MRQNLFSEFKNLFIKEDDISFPEMFVCKYTKYYFMKIYLMNEIEACAKMISFSHTSWPALLLFRD